MLIVWYRVSSVDRYGLVDGGFFHHAVTQIPVILFDAVMIGHELIPVRFKISSKSTLCL